MTSALELLGGVVLVSARVLLPLSQSRRNRAWEAEGLLDGLAGLEGARS